MCALRRFAMHLICWQGAFHGFVAMWPCRHITTLPEIVLWSRRNDGPKRRRHGHCCRTITLWHIPKQPISFCYGSAEGHS